MSIPSASTEARFTVLTMYAFILHARWLAVSLRSFSLPEATKQNEMSSAGRNL
jgi:hypothetical protein